MSSCWQLQRPRAWLRLILTIGTRVGQFWHRCTSYYIWPCFKWVLITNSSLKTQVTFKCLSTKLLVVIRWLVILCNIYLHRFENCGTLIGTLVSLAAADPAKPEPEVLRDVDARPHSIAQPISNALQIKTRLLIETACFVVRGSRVIGP